MPKIIGNIGEYQYWIPEYTDAADIETAFKLSLYGEAMDPATPDALSISAYLGSLNTSVTSLNASVALKAPLAAPTFTGTVVLPSTTSIGNVSATEISYLDGVTSNIQDQLSAIGQTHDGATAEYLDTPFPSTDRILYSDVDGYIDFTTATRTWLDGLYAKSETGVGAMVFAEEPTLSGNVTFSGPISSSYSSQWVNDVDTGTPKPAITLGGTSPNIYFNDTSGTTNAMVGINSGSFFVLSDTDRDGKYDTSGFEYILDSSTLVIGGNVEVATDLKVGGGYGNTGLTILSSGVIQTNGPIYLGKNTSTNWQSVVGGILSANNGYFYGTGDAVTLGLSRTNNGAVAQFYRGSTTMVGSIGVTTAGTTYNTTSDYRLKENVVPLLGAVEKLKSLKPSRFNFISNPETTIDGFIAHEVAEVVPEGVTGEKDAVDAEGNPEYQSLDASRLVPLLTAALQEAITRIEVLEAEVASLKK